MKFPYIILLTLAFPLISHAQLPEAQVLDSIESNNLTLQALRQDADALKAAANTSRKMPDLEVSLGYLWPGRKDISASQPLDWAVISGLNHRIVEAKGLLYDNQYAISRQEILLDARLTIIEATYQTALTNLRSKRAEALANIALFIQRRLDAGDARQMDANNAAMAHASALRQLALAQADLEGTLLHLNALNGDKPISPQLSQFTPIALPDNFDAWFFHLIRISPQLKVSAAQASIAMGEHREARAQSAPQLSIGFMGEFSDDEKYKGVTLGVTLPLWRSRQSRNATTLSAQAAVAHHTAAVVSTRAEAQAAWNRAKQLAKVATDMRQAIQSTSNADLLAKALEAGEISLTECLTAADIYFEAEEEALAAERDYQIAAAQLTACEL